MQRFGRLFSVSRRCPALRRFATEVPTPKAAPSATTAMPKLFSETMKSPFLRGSKEEFERVKKSPILVKLFSSFFAKDVSRTVDSANLYELCGKQALNRAFYDVFELPESYASHLELAILHVWMCKLRLSKEAEGRGRFLDQVLERMWEHVGRSLTGAGAPVVRMDKFLKEIQQSAFGSFVSYDHALTRMRDLKEAKDSNSTDPLMSALSNSLYGEDPPRRFKQLAALSSYVLSQMEIIDKMPLDNLKTAKFKFSDPALFS